MGDARVKVTVTREAPRGQGFYLTDLGDLNDIYQAARVVLIHPDKFTRGQLARAIAQAEREEQ